MTVASVISYCTNDHRFLRKCVEEAKKFSSQIVVPVCDHFFDGSPENRQLLETTYAANPECQFVEFSYSPTQLYHSHLSLTPLDEEWIPLWHLTSRYIGFLHLEPHIEYVLFLDCDEIVEGERFAEWLSSKEHTQWNGMRLHCYYYILRPTLRAKKVQELTLFAKKTSLESFHFSRSGDRYALFRSIEEPKTGGVRGVDGKPLIHHYSWVRPQEESLHKAKTWAHRSDCDWPAVIRESFAGKQWQKLFGTEFDFEEISSPYFDPFQEPPSPRPPLRLFPPVKKVSRRDILQKELAREFDL